MVRCKGPWLRAGQVVIVDWREDAQPKEANKRRPAIVVQDHELFAPEYQNVILVPLAEDARLVISGRALEIGPTP